MEEDAVGSHTQNLWSANAMVLELVEELLRLAREGRHVTAIAGAPGSGKSTLSEYLASELNSRNPESTAIVPMDGFHLDDAVLRARNTLSRKGAPWTFDVGGMAATLRRLKENEEPDIAVPVFDRGLEISRAGARLISRNTPLLLVEGNYLLLDQQPWTSLQHLYDLTVFLKVPIDELERRLVQRWIDHGLEPSTAVGRARENDLENAKLIVEYSVTADVTITETTTTHGNL